MAINAITGKFERHTGRKLAARVYRNPVQISGCGTTVNDETVTGAGLNAVKALDDVAGAGVALGSRVAVPTSSVALELTKKAKATGSPVTLTFGSAPMTVDGTGCGDLWLPEYPVHEVYSIKHLDALGMPVALVLDGIRIQADTGHVILPNDSVPKGELNVEVECLAGYRAPNEVRGDPGDWEAWSELEMLAWRAIQVAFQDFMQQVGRTGDINVLQATQHVTSFTMPADIREGLRPFTRLW